MMLGVLLGTIGAAYWFGCQLAVMLWVVCSMLVVVLAFSSCVSDVPNETVGSGGVSLAVVVNRSISLSWSLFTSGIEFGRVGACSTFEMSWSAAVILLLSLGRGKGTFVGNHVMVLAIWVPLVLGLYTL
jgi:hypothetical protein